MGKKSKARFITEKRQQLVDKYNEALCRYGKNHSITQHFQKKLMEFDKETK